MSHIVRAVRPPARRRDLLPMLVNAGVAVVAGLVALAAAAGVSG